MSITLKFNEEPGLLVSLLWDWGIEYEKTDPLNTDDILLQLHYSYDAVNYTIASFNYSGLIIKNRVNISELIRSYILFREDIVAKITSSIIFIERTNISCVIYVLESGAEIHRGVRLTKNTHDTSIIGYKLNVKQTDPFIYRSVYTFKKTYRYRLPKRHNGDKKDNYKIIPVATFDGRVSVLDEAIVSVNTKVFAIFEDNSEIQRDNITIDIDAIKLENVQAPFGYNNLYKDTDPLDLVGSRVEVVYNFTTYSADPIYHIAEFYDNCHDTTNKYVIVFEGLYALTESIVFANLKENETSTSNDFTLENGSKIRLDKESRKGGTLVSEYCIYDAEIEEHTRLFRSDKVEIYSGYDSEIDQIVSTKIILKNKNINYKYLGTQKMVQFTYSFDYVNRLNY